MNLNESRVLNFRVGLFSLLGIVGIVFLSFYVNDRPNWWRKCNLVFINVEDATGLKTKAPIRSLGIQIGHLASIELHEAYVRMGICITADVEVLPATRAYIRGEGFMGDKFVELKPVRYTGKRRVGPKIKKMEEPASTEGKEQSSYRVLPAPLTLAGLLVSRVSPLAIAQDEAREIPIGNGQGQDMQQVVTKIDGLVNEMTKLTTTLRDAVDPAELKRVTTQLSSALESATKTLSPQGGLTSTAQRSLSKLEDAIEQLRDQMTRINSGRGSVGMLLNDPSYAEEIREGIRNVNRMLGKFGGTRLMVDIGVEQLPASGTRAWGRVAIWPAPDRYYLLGATQDPRGKIFVTNTVTTTDTTTGGTTTTVVKNENELKTETTSILLTGMLGKVFWKRLEFAAGFLHGDGAVSIKGWFGPTDLEERIQLQVDVFGSRQGNSTLLDVRGALQIQPFTGPYLHSLYVRGGLDSIRRVNGQFAYFVGAGLSFDDQDIKSLFVFL